MDDILGQGVHLNKFKVTETTQCLVSGHSGIKLEINNKKISEESQNIRKINNTFPNNRSKNLKIKFKIL